jgi:hypothetical protein
MATVLANFESPHDAIERSRRRHQINEQGVGSFIFFFNGAIETEVGRPFFKG